MKALLIALAVSLSLCADCFAVSVCSGPSLRGVPRRHMLSVSLLFAVVHVVFLLSGFFFGHLTVGYVEKFAKWIGFVLLLYVGCSMLVTAFSSKDEFHSLEGFRNILISSVATSIDALAVGISMSMGHAPVRSVLLTGGVLFIVTVTTVLTGLLGGRKIGERFGKQAEIIGGFVLVGLGVGILL